MADVQLQPSTRAALEGIDLLIDAFELPEAVGELQQLIATLRASPSNVNGCIQAMDVLGQCYITMRKLKPALQVYEDLIAIVEAKRSGGDLNQVSPALSATEHACVRGALRSVDRSGRV